MIKNWLIAVLLLVVRLKVIKIVCLKKEWDYGSIKWEIGNVIDSIIDVLTRNIILTRSRTSLKSNQSYVDIIDSILKSKTSLRKFSGFFFKLSKDQVLFSDYSWQTYRGRENCHSPNKLPYYLSKNQKSNVVDAPLAFCSFNSFYKFL